MFFTGKLDRLIDDLERAAANERSVLSRKEYTDTPLIFTASQMKSFTPDRIVSFRREFGRRTVYTADPKMFLRQARAMADYEDSYSENAEFSSAFPSYAAMNDAQLRTYFSWRTKLRRGKLEKTSLSYAYVYIFELLNTVGAETPADAFIKLRDFFEKYGELDENVFLYRGRWLTDFAVYYGLEQFYGELPLDDLTSKGGAVLLDVGGYSDDRILDAVECFSSYSLARSSVYKKAPELCSRAVAAVVRELDSRFAHSGGFAEHYCGRRKLSYFMFASAVVYTESFRGNSTVTLPDGRTFSSINGHWLKTVFYKEPNCSRDLGALMRTVDIILRDKLKMKNKIKPSSLNTGLQTVVRECIDRVFDEKRAEEKRKRMDSVRIDFSNLDSIRTASDRTGERLMTEEDTEPPVKASEAGIPQKTPALNLSVEAEKASAFVPSDETFTRVNDEKTAHADNPHTRLIGILLDGGDASAFAHEAGIPLSMLCDEINEKYFDDFGDTVIDFDGDTPYIIPDYAEELRGMLK